ncbi:MAG TPA: hypothetical protein VMU85_04080 [Stellaceae bacterium]|nr:hypothetical protein [Stellaceae bacterium]
MRNLHTGSPRTDASLVNFFRSHKLDRSIGERPADKNALPSGWQGDDSFSDVLGGGLPPAVKDGKA